MTRRSDLQWSWCGYNDRISHQHVPVGRDAVGLRVLSRRELLSVWILLTWSVLKEVCTSLDICFERVFGGCPQENTSKCKTTSVPVEAGKSAFHLHPPQNTISLLKKGPASSLQSSSDTSSSSSSPAPHY
eukprot:scaffold2525_cov161-Skeletonema_marinoi.AAC.1